MRYCIVVDCNRRFGRTDFRVHRADCRDAVKESGKSDNAYHVDGENVEDAIRLDLEGYASDEMGYVRSDYYVCNCAK